MHTEASLITRGTPAFRRTNLALFAAGFSTFALLYCVQPLMPLFSAEFGLGAAASSLSLSVTTGLLAVAMLVASSLSEALGRKPVMVASLLASAALTIAAAFVPGWHGLLLVRTLEGVALSGLPAVAMAYVGEEMEKGSIGLAMGLYIGGSAVGGMGGRLISGILADFFSWRVAIGALGLVCLLAALAFWKSLPPSRNFRPRPLALGNLLARFVEHCRDEGLPWLFLEGFLLMGSFVTLYNYVGYRLLAPPYELGQTAVGSIFAVYLIGIFSSAWVGNLASRLGRRRVLWAVILLQLAGLGLTLATPLPLVIAGIAVFTFGFFGAHSIVSSWVGLRALEGKAQASSLYLFFYYLGSSLVGSAGGLFWTAFGWPGLAALLAALLATALLVAFRLAALAPLPQNRPKTT
ncbi:MFS transporter [Benzoatithermus flavus]|uniref:MFS transporter n=1 Tax=Benzoatithermus flavus TaxID=3108223 RepID=A0ABU8XST1_9PROT